MQGFERDKVTGYWLSTNGCWLLVGLAVADLPSTSRITDFPTPDKHEPGLQGRARARREGWNALAFLGFEEGVGMEGMTHSLGVDVAACGPDGRHGPP